MLRQFKPPYDESFQVPDPTVAQVLVEHNTTHIYTTPGEGWGHCLSGPELGQPTFGYGSPYSSHFDPAWVGGVRSLGKGGAPHIEGGGDRVPAATI